MDWLSKNTAFAVLADLATGQRRLTHQALDQRPHSKPVEHLRSILVCTGALPVRDEYLARLGTVDQHHPRPARQPRRQELLHRYAVWHLLRRLRQRNHGKPATYHQFTAASQRVRSAIALLDWLRTHSVTLSACRQADIDAWLTRPGATHLAEAGQFVRWATTQRVVRGIDYLAIKWQGPSRPLDHGQRWEQKYSSGDWANYAAAVTRRAR